MTLFYFLVWGTFRVYYTVIGRKKVRGLENLPPKGTGGAIIAANHMSLNDPPLIGASLTRHLNYMAKKELFDIPIIGWGLKNINAFPVNREGADSSAIRKALKLLRSGELLVMFPGGTRTRDREKSLEFKNGAGMISCMAQVPVIPCLLQNTDRMKKLARVMVTFGKPVYPPAKYSKADYRELTGRIIAEMKRLS